MYGPVSALGVSSVFHFNFLHVEIFIYSLDKSFYREANIRYATLFLPQFSIGFVCMYNGNSFWNKNVKNLTHVQWLRFEIIWDSSEFADSGGVCVCVF